VGRPVIARGRLKGSNNNSWVFTEVGRAPGLSSVDRMRVSGMGFNYLLCIPMEPDRDELGSTPVRFDPVRFLGSLLASAGVLCLPCGPEVRRILQRGPSPRPNSTRMNLPLALSMAHAIVPLKLHGYCRAIQRTVSCPIPGRSVRFHGPSGVFLQIFSSLRGRCDHSPRCMHKMDGRFDRVSSISRNFGIPGKTRVVTSSNTSRHK
jgi:hypothetical protein